MVTLSVAKMNRARHKQARHRENSKVVESEVKNISEEEHDKRIEKLRKMGLVE
ncbi:MAG: hypothetical protein KJ592_02535 [Nanoarchaeota archaeon]|nr:hypothetical protein [Nanoarchaeota archaeon]